MLNTSFDRHIAIGDVHEIFPEFLPSQHMTNFDYRAGEDILVHISLRPVEREVVLNQLLAGVWGDEARFDMDLSNLSVSPLFTVSFGNNIVNIRLSNGRSIRFDRPAKLGAIRELRTTLPFELNVISAEAAKPPAPAVAELSAPAAAPPPPPPKADASRLVAKPEMPDYVKKVVAEYETVQLTLLNKSPRPLPDRWSPIIISVVKNEFDRLYDFLRHYREAGIERFIFIDNGSTDGTIEFLRAQPDVDLYARLGKFDWMLKQGWVSKAISMYGFGRWYMYLDADEHLVFDGIGERSFRDLAKLMESRGILRVRGFLVDMYSDGPLLDSTYRTHSRLIEAYRFFDLDSYKEERYREVISVKGGPRTRVFGRSEPKFKPEMTKYPLFKLNEGEFMANPHHIWPYTGNFNSDRFIAVLHFKFLPGVINRIRKAIDEKNYWDGSFEYKCYLNEIDKDRDLSLMYDGSHEFTPDIDLVSLGIIEAIDWGKASGEAQFLAKYFERRAELDCAQGLSDYTIRATASAR